MNEATTTLTRAGGQRALRFATVLGQGSAEKLKFF